MIVIHCPWCGPRNEDEFSYGGEAHVSRPKKPEACSDEEWASYLYVRSNTKGMLADRWYHASGCRRWFNTVRDTKSEKIVKTYKIGGRRPNLSKLDSAERPAVQSTDGLRALAANSGAKKSNLDANIGKTGSTKTHSRKKVAS